MGTLTTKRTLIAAALLIAPIKAAQFAFDHHALFYFDSGAYLLNALNIAFISYRSYVYGWLIGAFAVPFHALWAIVAMQVAIGACTAWLLAFSLMRFFGVRPWIALAAALIFAFDPVQIVHERLIVTEAATLLVMALYLACAFAYVERASWYWLPVVSLLGAVLVSLRLVYIPVVAAASVVLPLLALFPAATRPRTRALALGLLVSCGSMALFQSGYRHLTGAVGGREPAYQYQTGFFLLSTVAPLLKPQDSSDPRVSAAIAEQGRSELPLTFDSRPNQLWDPPGLINRLRGVFGGDERQANDAALATARACLRRDPWGFLKLGFDTWLGYWKQLPITRNKLEFENGMQPPTTVAPFDAAAVRGAFSADVSRDYKIATPSRRYHIAARYWFVLLLLAPFLSAIPLWANPAYSRAAMLLFCWNVLLLVSTCLGATEVVFRYLHPFSYTALIAVALLCERAIPSGDLRRRIPVKLWN